MTDPSRLAKQTASKDPEVGLSAVAALRKLLERLEALQVRRAREHGWTWEEIAERLGVSKQAVHKKYGSGQLGKRLSGALRALGSPGTGEGDE